MVNILAISDIHGEYELLMQALENWNKEDYLVFLGDYVDRGPRSLDVLTVVMNLYDEYPDKVRALLGNHDQMFLDFLAEPFHPDFYYKNGGYETIKSFRTGHPVEESIKNAIVIDKLHKDKASFLKELPVFEIIGKVLLTHAGYNPHLDNWLEGDKDDFIWIRHHYRLPNNTGYVNVFGHTPCSSLNPGKKNFDVWTSKCKTLIGIDGGACYGGQLNAVLLSTQGEILDTYSYKK